MVLVMDTSATKRESSIFLKFCQIKFAIIQYCNFEIPFKDVSCDWKLSLTLGSKQGAAMRLCIYEIGVRKAKLH